MKTILDNELLRIARNYTGLNQTAFAKKLNVSQSLISGIEKSIKPLTEEIVEKLIPEFGAGFFYQKIRQPELKVYYRSSANIAKKYTDLFESRLQIISNTVSVMLESIDIPDNKIPALDLEDFQLDAEYLAQEMRNYFGLGNKPIDDIVGLMERNGVIVYFYDYQFISAQNKNFDGVSFYVKGVPVIMINNKIQNARKIFTIAHELCHLIAHNHNHIFISKGRDIEKEAHKFASEFIAPKAILRSELVRLSFEKLFELKRYWRLSAGALLYKAKSTVLTDEQYKRWAAAFSPYRKQEPHDLTIERPKLLPKIFDVFKTTLDADQDIYSALYMHKDIFEEVFWNIETGDGRGKLRIMI